MSHNGTRRHFSPQEKVAVLRRHLLEGVPISQLCDELQISPNLLYIWQREFFENGHLALSWTGARPSTVRRVEVRRYRPHPKVWDVEDLYRGRGSKRKIVRRLRLSPQMVNLVQRLN